MSLANLAAAVFGSRPIFLYQFSRLGSSWQFNTSAKDISRVIPGLGTLEFEKLAISHDKIIDAEFSYRSELLIRIPLDASLFQLAVIASGFSTSMNVKIWRTDASEGEVLPVFSGKVISVKPEDKKGVLEISCLTAAKDFAIKGLVGVFQKTCRHVHYAKGCNLNIGSFNISGEVSSISADFLTYTLDLGGAAIDSGDYILGILSRSDGQRRFITNHSATEFKINALIPGMEVGETVEIAPGCNLSRERCNQRFSNIENFGGFPFIIDNPFDGRQVF